MSLHPIPGKILLVEVAYLPSNPGRHMYTVGNILNRHMLLFNLWPEPAPHLPCHSRMQSAHCIPMISRSHGKHSHIVALIIRTKLLPQRQALLSADPKGFTISIEILLYKVYGENILACRDRRMSGKNCRCANPLDSISKRPPFLNLLPDAPQHHKSCVSFIGMPDSRLNTQRPQDMHPTHAKDDLLLQAYFLISNIESGR